MSWRAKTRGAWREGRGGRVAEDSATVVKIAKDKDPSTIHRLGKNKIKLATIILNLVTLYTRA